MLRENILRGVRYIEFHPNQVAPDLDAVVRGHAAYEELWRRFIDSFEDFHAEPEELLDLGDHLLATTLYRGHGSGSGLPVEIPLFQLFRLRRGLVVWQKDFSDRSEALEAAARGKRTMSRENIEVVRQPVAVGARSRRRLDERLAVRLPAALALVVQLVWRLSPRSRVRRALIRQAVQVELEAVNRGDYESTFAFYHPEGELITPPQLVGLGLDPLIRGREQRIDFQRRWIAEWGEFRFEPEEIIDLGDRLLLIGRIKGSGTSSGAAFDDQWANLLTISAGRVIGEQPFFDHRQALETAGLRE
jgi:ketosteroid isomerase-like protein